MPPCDISVGHKMAIEIMGATLNYLRYNQIWPPDGTSNTIIYYLRYLLMTVSTTITVAGCIMHIVHYSIQRGVFETLSDDLIMMTAELGVYYFVMVFVPYQKELADLLSQFCDSSRFGRPSDLQVGNKRLQLWCRLYKTSIDLVIVAYFIEPMFTGPICERSNEFRKHAEICGYPASIWLPVDLKRSPQRQIIYVWQTYSLLMTLKGAAVVSFFIMETMEHLVIRIRHFKGLLSNAINTEDEPLREKRWQHCIMYHRQIFGWGLKMDKCYQLSLFVHAVVTGLLFGIIGFSILNGIAIKTLSLFLGWFLAVFIVSVSGQHLYDEFISVADVIYNSKWYERDAKFQKDIQFMLMRAQKPVKIHAGPFSQLSHVFILAILKTGYSYTTLLKASSRN